jgi:hypothetical protein
VQEGRAEVARVLVDAGADVDAAMGSDGRHTPLSIAVGKGFLEITRALLAAGADVNKVGITGSFIFAILQGACMLEIVQVVIESAHPLYVAAHAGLLDFYPLLPLELTSEDADNQAMLAFLVKKERAARRQELLVCVPTLAASRTRGMVRGCTRS